MFTPLPLTILTSAGVVDELRRQGLLYLKVMDVPRTRFGAGGATAIDRSASRLSLSGIGLTFGTLWLVSALGADAQPGYLLPTRQGLREDGDRR